MLQRLQRLDRLRAWLGLALGLGFSWALLFCSWLSPRWLLLYASGAWAGLMLSFELYATRLAGGRAPRRLLARAAALLQAPPSSPQLSPEARAQLTAQEERLKASLDAEDHAAAQRDLSALEEAHERFAASHWQSLRELLVLIALAFGLAVSLKALVVEPFHIPSASMFPTLHVGDHIFVNKIIYGVRVPFLDITLLSGWRTPARGEVIVFAHDEETDYIKRVIAIPGDEVEVTADEIKLNGARLAHEYLGPLEWQELDAMTNTLETRHSNRFIERGGHPYEVLYDDPPYIMPSRRFVVPPGEYMVLGDNRDHSFDSLDWGFVPLEKIRGRAMFVLGSLDRGVFDWSRIGISIW